MDNNNRQATSLNWLNLLAGVWLIAAPTILGYLDDVARSNDVTVGIVIAGASLFRILSPIRTMWLNGVNILAGLWMILAPFILGYIGTIPRTNDIIIGVIVTILAIAGQAMTQRPIIRKMT